jgi:glycosyltransferase involved in cell wall biosynthesis
LGIRDDAVVVGSISWMYAPRWWLMRRHGIKGHEDLIGALASCCRRDDRVVGVIAGGAWAGAVWYERRLRDLASALAGGRILMPGPLPSEEARSAIADFDCVAHVPTSENCGGVIEPLLAGVPVVAARVGGLPEVVREGETGRLVPPRDPAALASTIGEVIADPAAHRAMAERGRRLVRDLFDVRRTGAEVAAIYRRIRDSTGPRGADSRALGRDQ